MEQPGAFNSLLYQASVQPFWRHSAGGRTRTQVAERMTLGAVVNKVNAVWAAASRCDGSAVNPFARSAGNEFVAKPLQVMRVARVGLVEFDHGLAQGCDIKGLCHGDHRVDCRSARLISCDIHFNLGVNHQA